MRLKHYIKGLVFLLFASSCNSTKFLDEGQAFLKANKVVVISNEKKKKQNALSTELTTLFKQKPNQRRLFINRRWFYYKTRDVKDTTKFIRFVQTNLAQNPSIFKDKLANQTAEEMKFYLQNKGYYQAETYYEKKIKGKKATVNYFAKTGDAYTANSVIFRCADKDILLKLLENKSESFFKSGSALSKSNYDAEVNRIVKMLRNEGYYNFNKSFIDQIKTNTDTVGAKKSLDIKIEVLLPKSEEKHTKFYIGNINVYPAYSPSIDRSSLKDTLINGLYYHYQGANPYVRFAILGENIFLKSKEVFNADNYEKTVASLNSLNIFQFVTVRPVIDSLQKNIIHYDIQLVPTKKMVAGWSLEFNTTNGAGLANALLGGSFNVNYKNRNIWRSAAQFNLTTELTLQYDFRYFYNAIRNIRLEPDINYPKFLDYLGIWRGLDKIKLGQKKGDDLSPYRKILSDDFYRDLTEKTSTKFALGYNNYKYQNIYEYNLFNARFGYAIIPNANKRYGINHINIEFLNPKLGAATDTIQLIKRTLSRQLFTGVIFRDFNYTYIGNPNRYNETWEFRTNIEQSGAEVALLNELYNLASGKNTVFKVGTIEFSKFVRLELDARYKKRMRQGTELALRLNTGLAMPWGGSNASVPYVKQFYGGGQSSVRAWRFRELGPGAFIQPPLSERQPYYQSGDMRIEFNSEYRFDIFKWFKGGLFIDGGNIWTLKEDPERPNAKFISNFWRQFGIGAGYGLRVDFSYGLIRFDISHKIRSPYQIEGNTSRWMFNGLFDRKPVFLIAIGNAF